MSDQMPPPLRTGPNCGNPPEGCRIITTSRVQDPVIVWSPEYNGLGQVINFDPNVFITGQSCEVCGGEWEDTITMTVEGASTATRVVTPPRNLAGDTRQTKR